MRLDAEALLTSLFVGIFVWIYATRKFTVSYSVRRARPSRTR